METLQTWNPERADGIVATRSSLEGPLLPILHALQAAFGCISGEAVAFVAERLNLSRAEVHGVVTFYPDFRRKPAAGRIVRLCRAEACQARGGDLAAAFLLDRLGLPSNNPWGGTTADGAVTVEPVYCLGLCAVAPAALIDGEPVGRFDGAALARAVAG